MIRYIDRFAGVVPMRIRPKLIVSGGQTGVDRAALDAAAEVGVKAGGWCPRGRLAEDGRIPDRYPVRETDSSSYAVRTERNVLDSDATLVLCSGRPAGGTALTIELARRHGKPVLVADPNEEKSVENVRSWLKRNEVAVLNVAGPRESAVPGIGKLARAWLIDLLKE
jgi:hypothetical protein